MGEFLSLYRSLEALPGSFFGEIDASSPVIKTKGRVVNVPHPHRFHGEDFYLITVDDGIDKRDFLVRENFLLACDVMIDKGDILILEAFQQDFYGEHMLFVFDFEKQNHLNPQGGTIHE